MSARGQLRWPIKIVRFALRQLAWRLGAVTDPFERLALRRKKLRGELTNVRCLVPFTRLEFLGKGLVTSCCHTFTKVYSVGNMKRGSVARIWNGRALQRLRRRLLLGRVESVCQPNCPYLSKPPIPIAALPEQTAHERTLKEHLAAGQTFLTTHPAVFTLTNWGACNLRCRMCNNYSSQPMPAHVAHTHEQLKAFFDEKVVLVLTGNGDPLARRDTRELLINFPSARHPGVRFEILTNGLLWTREMWAKIRHCRFSAVNVSIDAATRETYESIRRGGRWEALQAALQVLKDGKDEGLLTTVNINMTVMRSNYREIPAFAAMARRFGFGAYFTRIRGAFGDENIFDPPDALALAELRRVLADPSLAGKDLDLAPLAEFQPGSSL